jgi:hypothetical protein
MREEPTMERPYHCTTADEMSAWDRAARRAEEIRMRATEPDDDPDDAIAFARDDDAEHLGEAIGDALRERGYEG